MTRPSTPRHLVLSVAILLAASPLLAGPAGTVKGTYTIKGTTYTPTNVYAVARPDFFDKSKEGVELLFTTKPVPEADLADAMPGEGPRLTANVGAEGALYGVTLIFDQGSASSGGTEQVFEKKVLDKTTISGRIFSKKEIEVGGTKARFDLTFEAPIYRPKKAPPATAAERATATKSPQAKAYAAYLKALHAGDLEGLKKVVANELVSMMGDPSFKEQLGFLQAMAPKTVDYVRLTESGDTATLEVETKTDVGAVDCIRQAGTWRIGKQKWTGKP